MSFSSRRCLTGAFRDDLFLSLRHSSLLHLKSEISNFKLLVGSLHPNTSGRPQKVSHDVPLALRYQPIKMYTVENRYNAGSRNRRDASELCSIAAHPATNSPTTSRNSSRSTSRGESLIATDAISEICVTAGNTRFSEILIATKMAYSRTRPFACVTIAILALALTLFGQSQETQPQTQSQPPRQSPQHKRTRTAKPSPEATRNRKTRAPKSSAKIITASP